MDRLSLASILSPARDFSLPLRSLLASTWTRYWFRPGGDLAIGICRICLFTAVYVWAYKVGTGKITQFATAADYYKSVPLSNYTPIGPVHLFAHSPPPAWLVDALVRIAYFSTWTSLLGILTRPSMIVSVFSVTFLVSLTESWGPYPSASYNVICLAGLAFMFGRAGDSLSLDEAFRRFILGRAPSYTRHNGQYWWPVLLGQFAVAMFYFGAFYAKFSQPDWSFDFSWAFSDNLRNSLSLPYNIRGLEMPWYIGLMMVHPLVWKSAAFGHMINQALPIAACFTRNPWARAAEAVVFAIGCVLLGVVMTLYNLPWIYLTAFFIDWDYFLGKGRPFLKRWTGAASERFCDRFLTGATCALQIGPRSQRAVTFYAAIFLGFYVFTVVSKTSPATLPYPFSSMLFYSSVSATKPYDVHRHYSYWGPQLMLARGNEEKEILRGIFDQGQWAFSLDANTNTRHGVDAITALRRLADRKIADYSGTNSDPDDWKELRLYIDVFHIPAYPAKPLREIAHRALIAVYDYETGSIRTAKGMIGFDHKRSYLEFATEGFNRPQVELMWRRDPLSNADPGPLKPIESHVDGNRAYFVKPEASSYLVLRVREAGEDRVYDFYGAIAY